MLSTINIAIVLSTITIAIVLSTITIAIVLSIPGLIWVCSTRYNVRFASQLSTAIGKRLQMLTLLLQLLFCHPSNRSSNSSTDVPLVK